MSNLSKATDLFERHQNEMYNLLDAIKLALHCWDVRFQFAHYDIIWENNKDKDLVQLDDIKETLLSDILIKNWLVYKKSWPITDICIRHQQGTLTRQGLILTLMYLDNNVMTRVAQPLDDNSECKTICSCNNNSMRQGIFITTPSLNDLMACRQSNGATI